MAGLLKRIIPCLDVDRGRVVKGIHFVELRDMGDPVELALQYEREGADEIVFLDINATAEARPTALDMVRRVAKNLSIPFTLGGGLRTVDDMLAFLDAGADKVALNSAALAQPALIEKGAQRFGSQCIVVAVDVKRHPAGYHEVFSHGGRKPTIWTAKAWVREIVQRGAGEILMTSIDRDGTGLGFDMEITEPVARSVPIPVIASGGANCSRHLVEAFWRGADAVLAATMFHSGDYRIADVKSELQAAGIPVRMDF